MRVVILHNAIAGDASRDERDVLAQVAAVREALAARGHDTGTLAVGLDLAEVRRSLRDERPDCVFNLVESLAGDERLILIVPGLLESMGLPFTGAPLQALLMTTNKIVAKRLLSERGLPTPHWYERGDTTSSADILVGSRVIIKPVWDHGSKGLDEEDVVVAETARELADRLAPRGDTERFVEHYVAGREFNLSMLAGTDGQPEVLPAAEIVFDGYADGQPRVVGYRAKWQPDSFAYSHTVPTFDLAPSDGSLVDELQRLALECWRDFGLAGYARVDFRVDADGRPWILEINVNPCLSSDAGFAAALRRAGISYSAAVARIVNAALVHTTPFESPHGAPVATR